MISSSRSGTPAPHMSDDIASRVPSVPASPMSHMTTPVNDSGDEWAISSLCHDQLSDMEPELGLDLGPGHDSTHDGLQDGIHDIIHDARNTNNHGHHDGIHHGTHDRTRHDEDEDGLALVMPRMLVHQPSSVAKHSIGKLKVLVAGRQASGKSQLLDTLISESPLICNVTGALGVNSSPILTERRASTSKGPGDHNLAFVDTRGWVTSDDLRDYVSTLTDYLDSLYQETASLVNGLNPASIQILGQSSSLCQFPHVDVCLYLVRGSLDSQDVEVLRAIAPYATIVPLVSRSDELTASEVFERKLEISRQLQAHDISVAMHLGGSPLAVSSRLQYNWDMTASEVMAPGYQTHVLVESELPELVEVLLSHDGARSLRHQAAQKFAEWVSSMHLRSTLNHRIHQPLQQPLLVPRQLVLNLSNARDGWDLAVSNPAPKDPVPSPANQRRSSLGSIENLDPLDLSGWSRTFKVVATLAAAVAAAALGALGKKWYGHIYDPATLALTPTPAKWQDFVERWGILLRVTLAT